MKILLSSLAGVAILFAVWRHVVAARAAAAASHAWRTVKDLKTRKDMLRLITDSQPRSIFVVDKEGRFLFANKITATQLKKNADELIGRPLPACFDPESSDICMQRVQEALTARSPLVVVDRKEGNPPTIIQSQFIPLLETPTLRGATLVLQEDITSLVYERERRERTLHQIVKMMVAIADRRDPDAADHSLRVGKLSQSIARELELDPMMTETAATAGELMNLGKMMVPTEILTRPGPLSPEEIKMVRNAMYHAAELLSGIEFDGPVAQTLLQAQERFDGGGWPDGWKGEDILITARIIAVANVFVALTSSRAHRKGIDPEAALGVLMGGAGTAYDPRVLTALANYLHSPVGHAEWNLIASAQQEPVKPKESLAKA